MFDADGDGLITTVELRSLIKKVVRKEIKIASGLGFDSIFRNTKVASKKSANAWDVGTQTKRGA